MFADQVGKVEEFKDWDFSPVMGAAEDGRLAASFKGFGLHVTRCPRVLLGIGALCSLRFEISGLEFSPFGVVLVFRDVFRGVEEELKASSKLYRCNE